MSGLSVLQKTGVFNAIKLKSADYSKFKSTENGGFFEVAVRRDSYKFRIKSVPRNKFQVSIQNPERTRNSTVNSWAGVITKLKQWLKNVANSILKKKVLILKASKDVCGEEINLVKNQCKLLGMEVYDEEIKSYRSLQLIFTKHQKNHIKFDYIYLCTHGDGNSFEISYGKVKTSLDWGSFSVELCKRQIFDQDSILFLSCCRGGLFKVTCEIMAACEAIGYVCGVKWKVYPWDLTTGFIVFLYNMETKNAEPNYAAKKASLATDFRFECYDRPEVISNAQFRVYRREMFQRLNWISDDGVLILKDKLIIKNLGTQVANFITKGDKIIIG